MPQIAPARVVRRQNSEHSTTGVKADASPDQAKSTNQKIMRLSGRATASPPAPITTVRPRPISDSCLSEKSGLKTFWKTSRTTADDARIRSESTVDMIAASTTTRIRPATMAGNSSVDMTGRMVS